MALWRAQDFLTENHVHFEPGVNEDLAATAVWGSQQIHNVAGAKYDGVFGIWYGKGPGVDRSTDPLKHGNYGGASKHGGVLVLCGDDPGAKSSSIQHQSEQALVHMGIPILNPSNVQDYLDFGLYGWALSRYSGCWVGLKCLTDTVESGGSVSVDPERVQVRLPDDFDMPEDGRIGSPAASTKTAPFICPESDTPRISPAERAGRCASMSSTTSLAAPPPTRSSPTAPYWSRCHA